MPLKDMHPWTLQVPGAAAPMVVSVVMRLAPMCIHPNALGPDVVIVAVGATFARC
jgi:hypothetical protein